MGKPQFIIKFTSKGQSLKCNSNSNNSNNSNHHCHLIFIQFHRSACNLIKFKYSLQLNIWPKDQKCLPGIWFSLRSQDGPERQSQILNLVFDLTAHFRVDISILCLHMSKPSYMMCWLWQSFISCCSYRVIENGIGSSLL